MSDTTGATERSTARVPQRWVSAARTVVAALVHSNLYISTAAASVAVSTMLLAGYPLEAVPAAIVFAATMFVYSLNRITDLDEDEQNVPRRAAFTRRYGRPVLALSVCGYLGAVALALAWGLPRVEFMALPPLVGGLYSLGRLKRLFLVKNLLVGAAWGVIPLGVPVYFGADPTVEVAVFAGYVTVMLTVAAVVFDIKDIEGDRQRGIRTVPVRFGPRVTRVVAGAVTVAAAGVVAGLVVAAVLPRTFLALLAVNAYVLAYTAVATPERGSLFYGFVADGEHLFLALLLAGAEFL